MVAAVRCPNQNCRKFMLVEEAQQGQVVACLICKQPIKVPRSTPSANAPTPPTPPTPPVVPEPASDLVPIFDEDEPEFKLE